MFIYVFCGDYCNGYYFWKEVNLWSFLLVFLYFQLYCIAYLTKRMIGVNDDD
nr:MAG TPA: WW domain-binding protein 1 [Caudoviricetes sp.]DAM97957.1 MAG TPA: WW domain-binding protein 1 [Caudoviricetes sp.]